MANSYYATQTGRTLTLGNQPHLSHALESYRRYQWEIEIDTGQSGDNTKLTLAAKNVSPIQMTSEDIVAHRVNDRYFYPGLVSPDEVTITFDNLVKGQVAEQLFDWFSSVYDPVHGMFTPEFIQGEGSFKRNVKVFQLDNTGFPVKHIHLFAAYPKSWKVNEFTYGENEFHTLEVSLRFDFVTQEAGITDS
ncbi:hypothetical protein HOE37_06440 [Candidatus Woesearchaeota archaeon]|jgi:hypothetical protein|nr:hypothetical protein [Candidatus Woesearchaeota archaeon]